MQEYENKAITETNEDWANTILNGLLPYNMYLYWFDDTLSGGADYPNTIPFTHANSLISAQFVPYLDSSDLKIFKIPYDKERFGYVGNKTPYVYRINVIDNFSQAHPGTKDKTLGSFTAYKPLKNIGGSRNWRNESKLYNYPYSVAYLFDGLCEPIEIKYQHLQQNINNINVRLALNINGDYSIYIPGYLGDTKGEMEQTVVTSSRDYPCSSSQYANWLATNKNSLQATQTTASISAIKNIGTAALAGGAFGAAGGPIGAAAGAATGAAVGVITSIASGAANIMNNQINMNAQEKDNRNIPNSLISKGSDLTMGINTVENKLKLYRYRQKDEYMNKIGDFFAMYGYKQNRLMQPNLRDRHFYNYIKTVGANVESTENVPLDYVNVIQSIFDNGVTIWHVDRNGVIVNDYTLDNFEV